MTAVSLKVNELFALWLGEQDTVSELDVLVKESLAAAKSPDVVHHDAHADDFTATDERSSSPPTTPPRQPGAARTAPQPQLHTRFLGVDEVEMHRALSPSAAASPNSPKAARVAPAQLPAGAHPVDPHIPRSPDAGPHRPPQFPQGRDSALPPNAARGSSPNMGRTTTPPPGKQQGHATYDDIARFYRPTGPLPQDATDELTTLHGFFLATRGPRTRSGATEIDTSKSLKRGQLGQICTDAFKLPAWTRNMVFKRVLASNSLPDTGANTAVRHGDLKRFYDASLKHLSPNRRLFELLRAEPRRGFLTFEDLFNAATCLVEAHPGLSFLQQPEFQQLYCKTVAARIIYELEQQQSRAVSWPSFDRSDVPDLMRSLDETQDINAVLRFFSYEHFYVLYCRFWELDTNKDHLLSADDLRRYGGELLNPRVVDRVARGYGHRLRSKVPLRMDFEDFVYFCLSEEDKNSEPAKRYWFGVLDVDGDGVVSGHDMEYFFTEQQPRFQQMASDELQFTDMLCQMLDMLGPSLPTKEGVTLAGLRRCDTPEHFINLLTNAQKFMMFEQRDPFAEHQMRQLQEKTQWDRFARTEYDRMASEAGGSE